MKLTQIEQHFSQGDKITVKRQQLYSVWCVEDGTRKKVRYTTDTANYIGKVMTVAYVSGNMLVTVNGAYLHRNWCCGV